MSNIQTLYVGNDTILELAALRNELTGEYLNDATVLVTLKTAAGSDVVGEAWPKAVSYVEGSNGLYRVAMGAALELVHGDRYSAEITATSGAGLSAAWSVECVAKRRQA